MCQVHGLRERKKFSTGENEAEIDFVLVQKEYRWFMHDVRAIPGEFQHALVIADIDKRK